MSAIPAGTPRWSPPRQRGRPRRVDAPARKNPNAIETNMVEDGSFPLPHQKENPNEKRAAGSPGKTVTQAVCADQRAGRLLPLTRRFRFTEIGSDSTLPRISYPEAASVVAFLIQRYGITRFCELYGRLRNGTAELELRRHQAGVNELYGVQS